MLSPYSSPGILSLYAGRVETFKERRLGTQLSKNVKKSVRKHIYGVVKKHPYMPLRKHISVLQSHTIVVSKRRHMTNNTPIYKKKRQICF